MTKMDGLMDVYMHICISNFPKPKFWLLPLNLCLSNSAWDHRNKLNRIIDAYPKRRWEG